MRRQIINQLVCTAAVAMLATSVPSASAQSLGSGERIINSHVVSDTVVGGSAGSYVGDLANENPANDSSFDCESCGERFSVGDCGAGCVGRKYGQPDLFYNYFTQGNCNAVNAQMYTCPGPVSPHVGNTHFTYQPFYPEEMLYPHKNRFHNYYDNGRGMNRTRAVYWTPPVRTAMSNFYWNYLRLPR
ncbi:hypothetical protein Q31b_41300 [Novipirellula aureliae]|uniref:Uncharacterized protein n=1 Tax=Novipirellula aureliae TaxID=2527966 RepID=A0A5C6DQL9_9BACT|nr:hypothetical protein [Novipirellula aureliae]TWU39048.1 hypothetical protein Q31b_41300 [Novipirellula aureliae]